MSDECIFSEVLLIEDDPGHSLLIKRALKSLVANVVECSDLGSALETLQQQRFELIISDVNLPDSSGVQLVDKIIRVAQDSPIIVLTSSNSLSDAVEAMKLGARDFLVKNFDEGFKEVLALSISRVYASVKAQEEKLRLMREMEVLQTAIENSRDALAVSNSEGSIHYSNSAFRELMRKLGANPEELLSFSSEAVKESDTIRAALEEKLCSLPGGAVWNTEMSVVAEEVETFDLSLTATSGKEDDDEAARSIVVWVRDISSIKRREKFQREILSTTTHDLKGPLGAVITATELLTNLLPAGEKPAELVLRVSSAAHGMVNLINEFLSARRIQEGNFILKPDQHSLQEVMRELEDNYGTIASARGIDLVFEPVADNATGCFDRLGFVRVLGNLLSNALKFTGKGGAVRVNFANTDRQMRVRVQDTGSGMTSSEVQRIFERFSRLDRHQEVQGTGIGLFVVKSIVEAHGGKVEVTSQVGEGTTFELSFPLQPPVNERGELISLDFQ